MKLRASDGGYTIYEVYELHLPILNCHCKRQRCKGKYIKSREGQKECLFSLAEKGILREHRILTMDYDHHQSIQMYVGIDEMDDISNDLTVNDLI